MKKVLIILLILLAGLPCYANSLKRLQVTDPNTATIQWNFDLIDYDLRHKNRQISSIVSRINTLESSGVFTPNTAAISNVTSITSLPVAWSRIGNVVTVVFRCQIDPVAGGNTLTEMRVAMPIPCTTTPTVCAGSCAAGAYNASGTILAYSSSVVVMDYLATSPNNADWSGSYSYVLN